jgi:hypothetical protein
LTKLAVIAEGQGVMAATRTLPIRLVPVGGSAFSEVERFSRQEFGTTIARRLTRLHAEERVDPLADIVRGYWTESFDVPPFSVAYRLKTGGAPDAEAKADARPRLRQAIDAGDPYAARLWVLLGCQYD